MVKILRVVVLGLGFTCFYNQVRANEVVIYVEHIFQTDTLNAMVKIKWEDLSARLKINEPEVIAVFDIDLGITIESGISGDSLPEWFYFRTDFHRRTPYKTFNIAATGDTATLIIPPASDSLALSDTVENISVTFLTRHREYIKQNGLISSMADKVVESIFTMYPEPKQLNWAAAGRWNYETGYFLDVIFKYMKLKNDTSYLGYIKRWVDFFIDENGSFKNRVYRKDRYRLDDINAGKLFIDLYKITHNERYKIATEQLVQHLHEQPRTSDGGYWHKEVYPHQMWLDGIFMADVFATQYATLFNEPDFYDEAIKQIKLMYLHAYDTTTGLLYHGWDESKERVWADPLTGASPSFWSRGMGWYLMALVECLDNIPIDHPNRAEVVVIFRDLAEALVHFQDSETGLWYQVTDKSNEPGNWHETSGTAMFAFAIAKGARMGYLDKKYLDVVNKAYEGLLQNNVFFDDHGLFYLTMTVMVGTLNEESSDGSYNYYISVPRRTNDFKGVSPFLDLCNELELY